MKPQDIKEISFDDATMYYDGAYALSLTGESPTILKTFVVTPEGMGRNVNAVEHIRTADLPETSTNFLIFCYDIKKCFSPEEFFLKYKIARIPLGWRNAIGTCIYLYSTPNRGVKKGYQPQDFKMLCPYAESLKKYRQQLTKDLRLRLEDIDDISKVDSIIKYHNTKKKNIETFLHTFKSKNIADLGPLEDIVPAEGHKFFSIEGAIDSLCDHSNLSRTGVALHSSIAATVTLFSPKNGASMFFHYNPIGELTRNGIEVYSGYENIVPQLERHLGVKL